MKINVYTLLRFSYSILLLKFFVSSSHNLPVTISECLPSEFSWGPSIILQFFLAKRDIGVPISSDQYKKESFCEEVLEIAAYMENNSTWSKIKEKQLQLGEKTIFTTNDGGIYDIYRGTCETIVNGIHYIYIRIYKGANDYICKNFKKTNEQNIKDGIHTFNKTLKISFIREPLDHFFSGYSEITFRRYTYKGFEAAYTFLNHEDSPEQQALAFINDLISGRLHQIHSVQDVHTFPQIAFLVDSLPLDFVGNVTDVEHDFKRLGLPVHEVPDTHRFTHNNTHRVAMIKLLETNVILKCAVVRVLLPDYICFRRYPIPYECRHICLEASCHINCPEILS